MNNLANCRYCSEVSLANQEDPIGTAGTAEKWIVVEVPRPWKKDIWNHKPYFKPLMGIVIELEQLEPDLSFRLMAIAPDKEYSQPNYIRVFYYFRPGKMFSQYEKQEYLVPLSQLVPLVRAILIEPQQLPEFANYQQPTNDIREILVCTHTQVDTACGRYGTPLYTKLRKDYAPVSARKLRVWQTSHFGGHKFAPTLIDFPSGRFWGHLQPEVLDILIDQRGSLEALRPYYRGWSGLEQFEQIAEREIWMKEGWTWQNHPKSGYIVTKDRGSIVKIVIKQILQLIPIPRIKFLLKRLDRDVNWVEVFIEYLSPNNNIKQGYKVRIESKGKVMTAGKSAKEMKLQPVKQYHVVNLTKISSQDRVKILSH